MDLRQRGLTRRCIPQYAAGLVTCDRPPLNGRPEIMATSQQVSLHHLNPIALQMHCSTSSGGHLMT